jgi:glycosyltransferase involved in cell wall biosynthesis
VYPPLTIDKYKVNNKDAKAITMVNLIDLKGGNLFWQLARVMPDREFIAVKGGYGNQIMYPKDLPNVTIMENQDDMREVFKKSRIILMPSSYESWGRVGMEAAVSGIPTIATATEGLLESLGNSGVFLENRDVASLVEAIRLLDHEETYKKHSEFAKKRALEVSSKFNSQIDDVEKAMLKIVNKKVS